jgi:hypothetical protein
MKETGVIFQGWGVNAIFQDLKSMTRRTKGLKLINKNPDNYQLTDIRPTGGGITGPRGFYAGFQHKDSNSPIYIKCPYGGPGDHIWVRETWKPVASGQIINGYGEIRYGTAYKADSSTRWNDYVTKIHDLSEYQNIGPLQFKERPWKPSIYMPYRASRLTLEVVSVRVERLQEIHWHDALKEGIKPEMCGCGGDPECGCGGMPIEDPTYEFQNLWESINGPGSWEANPWLWAIEFKRITEGAA